jgi:DNA-binding SARP family transcriptional activator/TolB-like protein/tetratricopeptide (TPR) repeat protein
MFSFYLLGGAVLEGLDGPVVGRAAHKRRLAVLAVLSAARGRGVARERLIGMLWPEHPSGAARHLLSESLYVLRKELGEGAFVAAGDEVGLNEERVRSDAAEMERAVEAGELARAAELYRGPFLDGFYVDDAPEFERWVEAERARLSRVYVRAAECLAEERERAGRPQEAAEWWRRLAVQDPFNARVALRLMETLDASGERASALWFYETHAVLLREELGVAPDPELTRLVERLRSIPPRAPDSDSPPCVVPVADGPHPPPASTSVDVRASTAAEQETASPTPLVAEAGAAADSGFAPSGEDPCAAASSSRSLAPRLEAAVPTPASGSGGGGDVAVGAEYLHAPPSSRRGWRWAPAYLAGIAGLLACVAAALSWRDPSGAFPGAAASRTVEEFDPRRVAIFYLDDHSPGGELGYLASGLTEMLIHELGRVEVLDVISRNGVKPYREGGVRFDSIVARLRVGSVVEGSVQRSGDSVRVSVQLIDANTQAQVESRVIVRPVEDLFALENAVAEEVSGFLRRRLGEEMRLRQAQAETRSAKALGSLLRAREAREDAMALRSQAGPDEAAGVASLLQRADSLLARAEAADPRWSRPTVLRGWLAYTMEALPGARREGQLSLAMARADRVLAREPRNAEALELRGTVRYNLGGRSADRTALLDGAERDLRGAVEADPSLASAWSTLSQLLRLRGRWAEADLAARRALAADAYLAEADDILHRLMSNAMQMADYPRATALCERGRRQFPEDWRFLECRLVLLREDRSRPPEPALAWRLLAELERMDPPARAASMGRAYSPLFRRVVAASVAARAGDADSALAVLTRARRNAGDDAELQRSLDYDEAHLRLVLGEPRAARILLARYVAARPALRTYVERDPLFRQLFPASSGAPASALP